MVQESPPRGGESAETKWRCDKDLFCEVCQVWACCLALVLCTHSWCVVVGCRWDYGYQTTAMANRTIIVDNNTWNTSHIATVGRAMSSPGVSPGFTG